jgi:hypothetical protein
MNKVGLSVAAAISLLTVGSLPNSAAALTLGSPSGMLSAIEDTALTENVALRCTHWWHHRWHRHLRCYHVYPLVYFSGPRFFGHRHHFRGFHGHRAHFGHHARRSDINLKHDIVLLGHLDNGLGFYRFNYNDSDKTYVGVMAQEVQNVMPEAVTRGQDGYLRVYYDKLGLQFQTYEQWMAAGAKVPVGFTPTQH